MAGRNYRAFSFGGRNYVDLSVRIAVDLVVLWVVEIDFFFVGTSKLT